MIPRWNCALVVAALFAITGVVAAASAAALPDDALVSTTLDNGMRVSILGDPTNPIVATQVWYHVGSANEEPATRGFAHLFEHLMFGGTTNHPKRSYWELHERLGGENNAYTSFDETVYVSEIPPSGLDALLELEADRMIHLDLNQENLDNEKRIVTEELRLSTENDPFSRLFTEALKTILDPHPYALTAIGTKADIEAATLDHAREFYGRYYRPRNAHLVVVGPVDAEATLAEVRRRFEALPADGETPADVPPVIDQEFPPAVDFREDLPPVEISVLGFPLPATDTEDYWSLVVLQELLGGGGVDPLEESLVRRRGKALMAGVETMSARRGGVLAFWSANLPYRRKQTAFRHLEQARSELARFDWLDADTLTAAKRRLRMEEFESVYWAAWRADRIGRARWWLGDERRAFDAAERIDEVTLGDVRDAFQRYVVDQDPVRVHVRPEHLPFLVRWFGWLYPIFGG